MALSKISPDVMNVAPDEEHGSEAIFGFDYQVHCAARLCLQMICSHEIAEIICEHHEDFIQIRNRQPPILCQVKKRESAKTWTLSLLKEAIQKLFEKIQYKNVGQLVIYGNGRPSAEGECSLVGLIALLDRPESERDTNWDVDVKPYESHLAKMLAPKIEPDTVKIGLRLLKIHLVMPHPEAIESENMKLAAQVINEVWGVEVSWQIAERAYNALYKKTWEASRKPKYPRTMKSISNAQARLILKEALHEGAPLAENSQAIVDIHSKLHKGNLEAHIIYALQMRMDARQIKFEMELGITDWQDFKADIAEGWEDFQQRNTSLSGASLWKQVRDLLKKIGEKWANVQNNPSLGPAFAEGVFFDMMAICEVDVGI